MGRIWTPGQRPVEVPQLFIPGRPAEPPAQKRWLDGRPMSEEEYQGLLEKRNAQIRAGALDGTPDPRKAEAEKILTEKIEAIKDAKPGRGEMAAALAQAGTMGALLTAPVAAAVSTAANWGEEGNQLPTIALETLGASAIGGLAVPAGIAAAARIQAARINRRAS
jgi:hypothetical protein